MNISNPNNESHALVLTSKYTGNSSQEMEVNISLNSLQGDVNADGYPSGMYFVKMIAGEFVNTKKLILIK